MTDSYMVQATGGEIVPHTSSQLDDGGEKNSSLFYIGELCYYHREIEPLSDSDTWDHQILGNGEVGKTFLILFSLQEDKWFSFVLECLESEQAYVYRCIFANDAFV